MKNLPNILIVDDTPENLFLIERLVEKLKINLIQADSGLDALDKSNGIDIALAIIDVRMPEMNGFELALKINEARPDNKVPVIFMTASNSNESNELSGYNSGAVDFISKPISNLILLSKINVFLDLFNQKDAVRREAQLLKESAEALSKVNEALKRSESKYRSYIENAPDGVFVTDENGRYIEVNEATCKTTGYSEQELLNMLISDILPVESSKEGYLQYKKLLTRGSAKADLRFIHKNGTQHWWTIEAVKLSETRFLGFAKDITHRIDLEESLRLHQVELEMQNEELRLAKVQAEIASKKYAELFNFSPSGIFTLTSDKSIQELNLAGAQMLGIGQQNLSDLKSGFDYYVSENTLPVFELFIRNIFKNKNKETCEILLIKEDKQSIFAHIEGMIIENGKLCLLNVVDITNRKLIEEKLKQTSTRLGLATHAGGVGIWDWDISSNQLIWDDQMFSLYGMKKSHFGGEYLSWLTGVHPDDLEQSSLEIQMAISGEKEFDTEFRVCWPDGSVHNIRALAHVVHDDTGKPQRLIGTNWDITEQKRLEEVIKSSEENFRTFFETIDDMVIVGNMLGEIIYANKAVYNTLNYTKEELDGMQVLSLNPVELFYEAEQIFSDMFAGKRSTCPLPLARKDGSLIPVETRVWFGKWNSVDCIFGISKNLSAEQEALQKFNKIFESNPALLAITTVPDGIFTDVNATFVAKTGYSRDEIIGKTQEQIGLFLKPEQQRMAAEQLNDNGSIHNLEFLIKTKSGNTLDGLFSGEKINSQGKEYFLTSMIDITDRKSAENVLRESESNLAEAQRIAHIGSWEWDIRTNNVKWSKEMFRVFDTDPESFDFKAESVLQVIHPDDRKLFQNNMNNNSTDGGSPTLEYRVIHKDGSVHNLIAEGSMEFDKEGKPVKSIGTVQDITDRKRAQEEINTVNNFLDSIVEHIPNMLFIKDAQSLKFVRFNKAGEDLIGITKDEILGKSDYDFFIKKQADGFVENDRKVLQSRKMLDIPEEHIQTRRKGTRLLHTKKVPILNSKGNPEYLLGISEDITELKFAEQTLKISEEKYRTMLNASPDGVFVTDVKGKITDVSEIGIELFGFEKSHEMIGKHFSSFIPAEQKQTYRDLIEKTLNEGIVQNAEIKIQRKNHSVFLAEASSTLIQRSEGMIVSFMIIIRDISQRKKMETKQIHADRMANLGEMASGIAHEINQPLNIISLAMDNILYEATKDENIEKKYLKNKLDKIFENIIRIRNIIDHVRAFSRSNDDYILADFDINSSILNAVTMISEQFKHMAIRLDLNLEKKLPLLTGNTIKFEQVIINLLSNAKDALLEKKIKLDADFDMFIEIRSLLADDSLIVEIIDNGTGISLEDIEHIMLPFYTTKDAGKGTGLGLSISYQIIKEMNGSIEIAGNRFMGTTFRIILKLTK